MPDSDASAAVLLLSDDAVFSVLQRSGRNVQWIRSLIPLSQSDSRVLNISLDTMKDDFLWLRRGSASLPVRNSQNALFQNMLKRHHLQTNCSIHKAKVLPLFFPEITYGEISANTQFDIIKAFDYAKAIFLADCLRGSVIGIYICSKASQKSCAAHQIEGIEV
jgi:hypothetical protein